MVDRRQHYRIVGRQPLGTGGFARVFEAERRSDGLRVAVKEPLAGDDAHRRLRREIQVQTQLDHPHVMPILDYDPDFGWLVMPLGIGNLGQLRPGVNATEFRALVHDIAEGLEVAHGPGLVHRDITPTNLLALPDPGTSSGRRWVVADWGLVRRPRGQTTSPLTRSGQPLGTEGFAAPETFEEPHGVTAAADVYSLGRVMAWYCTGRWPIQGRPLLPGSDSESWRYVISVCTNDNPAGRPRDMAELRALLERAFTVPALSPGAQAQAIVDRARVAGPRPGSLAPFTQAEAHLGPQDLVDLGRLALAHPDDLALYVDEVARLPAATTHHWVSTDPATVAAVAQAMAELLQRDEWGRRQFDQANRPLDWMLDVAGALATIRRLELLEDVTYALAQAARYWDRYPHNNRMRTWLTELDDDAGRVVGRAIRNADAAEFYLQGGFSDWPERIRSRALRSALGA
jgi:eukaryotic-like serine/threonine-protein kinase